MRTYFCSGHGKLTDLGEYSIEMYLIESDEGLVREYCLAFKPDFNNRLIGVVEYFQAPV